MSRGSVEPVVPARFAALPARTLSGGLTVVQASTWRARAVGLSGLRDLDDRVGLQIAVGSVHTFTMRLSLDLIWLDRDDVVIRVDRGVPPLRLRACRGAQAVIEVGAGYADTFLAALSA